MPTFARVPGAAGRWLGPRARQPRPVRWPPRRAPRKRRRQRGCLSLRRHGSSRPPRRRNDAIARRGPDVPSPPEARTADHCLSRDAAATQTLRRPLGDTQRPPAKPRPRVRQGVRRSQHPAVRGDAPPAHPSSSAAHLRTRAVLGLQCSSGPDHPVRPVLSHIVAQHNHLALILLVWHNRCRSCSSRQRSQIACRCRGRGSTTPPRSAGSRPSASAARTGHFGSSRRT